MDTKYEYKVCTRCLTFNHAPYIEDTLSGFSNQETTFPVIHCIIDDASTDGEQEVVKKFVYENFCIDGLTEETDDYVMLFIRHKSNINCYFAVYFLKYNHWRVPEFKKRKEEYFERWTEKAKYTALCEGDDYWTDPQKLQKQVDWLENHDDYSMCFHQAIEHSENGSFPDRPFAIIENRDYDGVELFRKWIVATASVVYRASIHNSQIFKETRENKNFCYGDITLFLSCAHEGKVRGMSDMMSVYRRNDGGVTLSVFNTYKKALKTAVHNHEIYKVFGEAYKADSDHFVLTILCSNFVKHNVPDDAKKEMIDYAKTISKIGTYSMICKFYILTRLREFKHRILR